jgi:hypothetical protein
MMKNAPDSIRRNARWLLMPAASSLRGVMFGGNPDCFAVLATTGFLDHFV